MPTLKTKNTPGESSSLLKNPHLYLRSMSDKRERFLSGILILIYSFLISFLYHEVDCRFINYRGFLYFEHSIYISVIFALLNVVHVFNLSKGLSVSKIIYSVFYFVLIVPINSITFFFYKYLNFHLIYFIICFNFFLFITFYIINSNLLENYIKNIFSYIYKLFLGKKQIKTKNIDLLVLWMSIIFSIIILIQFSHCISIKSSFLDWYEQRSLFKKEALSNIWLKINHSVLKNFFSHYILLLFLLTRKVKYIIISISIFFICFFISYEKMIFINIAFIIFIFFFLKIFSEKAPIRILQFFIFLYIVFCFFYFLTEHRFFSFVYFNIISRTLMYHPSLTYYYINFTQENGLNFFGEFMPIRWLAEHIFHIKLDPTPLSNIIGYYMHKDPLLDSYANENTFVTYFSYFGLTGIILSNAIIFFLLKIIDIISQGKNFIFYAALFLSSLIITCSAGIHSAILSGCILLKIIFLFFRKKSE